MSEKTARVSAAAHVNSARPGAGQPPVVPAEAVRPARSQALLDAVRQTVVIADGAMGTILQEHNPTLEDYQ